MRVRLASIAMMLGAVATGLSWLTLQPALRTLLGVARSLGAGQGAVARITQVLPFALAIDVLAATALIYVVLVFTVGRPLQGLEALVAQLARPELGLPDVPQGPLLSRVGRSLRQATEAVAQERAQNVAQLAELREKNEQLVRAQAELVASDRLATVGKLAAGVAHEVGNPLAGILGYLSIARGKVSPEVKDLLDRSEAEVQRIDRIVRSLLELGRPSRGAPQPVELAQVVQAVLSLLAAGQELDGVERTVTLEPGVVVRAEAGPLSQVLINLVRNAAQAMQGRGRLWLVTRSEGGRGLLEVRDSGPGIAPETLPKLFEPFFTTKPAGQGTGLGLAVSRQMLSTMGGAIEAQNHPEGGALFTVSLPLA